MAPIPSRLEPGGRGGLAPVSLPYDLKGSSTNLDVMVLAERSPAGPVALNMEKYFAFADDGGRAAFYKNRRLLGSAAAEVQTLAAGAVPVATPTIDSNGGAFTGPVQATPAWETAGATIHYPREGIMPPVSTGTVYGHHFFLTAGAPVRTDLAISIDARLVQPFLRVRGHKDPAGGLCPPPPRPRSHGAFLRAVPSESSPRRQCGMILSRGRIVIIDRAFRARGLFALTPSWTSRPESSAPDSLSSSPASRMSVPPGAGPPPRSPWYVLSPD